MHAKASTTLQLMTDMKNQLTEGLMDIPWVHTTDNRMRQIIIMRLVCLRGKDERSWTFIFVLTWLYDMFIFKERRTSWRVYFGCKIQQVLDTLNHTWWELMLITYYCFCRANWYMYYMILFWHENKEMDLCQYVI